MPNNTDQDQQMKLEVMMMSGPSTRSHAPQERKLSRRGKSKKSSKEAILIDDDRGNVRQHQHLQTPTSALPSPPGPGHGHGGLPTGGQFAAQVAPPPFVNNAPPLERRTSPRRMKTKKKQQEVAPPDNVGGVVEDPPDHMEERARRMKQTMTTGPQQRSPSVSSTSSMPSMSSIVEGNMGNNGRLSVPASPIIPMNAATHNVQQQQQRPVSYHARNNNSNNRSRQQKRIESAKSMSLASKSLSPLENSPISSDNASLLSRSHPVLPFPTSKEASFTQMNYDQQRRKGFPSPQQARQQSPHPADMLKGQAAAAAELPKMEQPTTSYNMPRETAINAQSSSAVGGSSTSSSDDGTPTFSIGNGLQSTESAEELRQLIEAMHTEFQRLRSSKLQAEARAEKLRTDLTLQRQEMEDHFESLAKENERLRGDANGARIELSRLAGEVVLLEDENGYLRGECARLQKGKEVAEAKVVATHLRARLAD